MDRDKLIQVSFFKDKTSLLSLSVLLKGLTSSIHFCIFFFVRAKILRFHSLLSYLIRATLKREISISLARPTNAKDTYAFTYI